jgi:predicted RNA-binding Zn ribbon-like protein
MDRKPLAIRLTADEAAVYDSRDDQAGAELRAEFDCRAAEIIDAGDVSSVTVHHPDGFVAWYYDRSDLRANGGVL